jgi:hypothetical protein
VGQFEFKKVNIRSKGKIKAFCDLNGAGFLSL